MGGNARGRKEGRKEGRKRKEGKGRRRGRKEKRKAVKGQVLIERVGAGSTYYRKQFESTSWRKG